MEGLELFSAATFDLVLTDVKMPRMDGIELMELIKAKDPTVEVIVFTGFGSMELAIEVMRLGGYDFLLKPDDLTRRMRSVVVKALEKRQLTQRNQELILSLQAEMLEKTNETRGLYTQHQITRILGEAKGIAEAAPTVLTTILQNTGWEYGAIWTSERLSNTLTCKTMIRHDGEQDGFVQQRRNASYQKQEGLAGQVWSQKCLLLCTEGEEPSVEYRPATEGKRQRIGFPILQGEKIFGVMEFFHTEIPPPNENLIGLLTAVGSQLAMFMEREQLEQQFRQSQKLEAIGRLAGGIAHDFNNLLTSMMGYAHLIERQVVKHEGLHRNAQQIQRTGTRAAALIQQLLTLSRSQVLKQELTDMNQVITDLAPVLERLLTERIEFRLQLMPTGEMILSDRTQLEQVIVNLCVNARDAMPDSGVLTIKTSVIRLDTHEAELHSLSPGKYVCLNVIDTGHGMDESVKTHLFEPFFTTKDKGKGSGLGLATVYSIITQSGGIIEVASEAGQGAIFSIYMPVATSLTSNASASVPEDREEDRPHGTETVLSVENEEDIRDIISHILSEAGYTVMAAANGFEALSLMDTYGAEIKLMIWDLLLPGMSGSAIVEQAMQTHPDLKILLISGSFDEFKNHENLRLSELPFLPKPFSPESLQREVRAVLDGTPMDFSISET
ncbi:MAG: response regulator [candidate division Zixibacteria bacterium]|nr:response regulator [candidate division Zixibacteria bacterium]